jgi:hypothetical protein
VTDLIIFLFGVLLGAGFGVAVFCYFLAEALK